MQDARQSDTVRQLDFAVAETLTAALSHHANMTAALKADIAHHVSSLWAGHVAPASQASNPTEPSSAQVQSSSPRAACSDPVPEPKHRCSDAPGRSAFQFTASPKASCKDSSASASHHAPEQNAMQRPRGASHEGKAEGGMAVAEALEADSLSVSACAKSKEAARQALVAWVLPVMATLADDKAGRGRLGRALVGPCLQGFLAQLRAMPTGELV